MQFRKSCNAVPCDVCVYARNKPWEMLHKTVKISFFPLIFWETFVKFRYIIYFCFFNFEFTKALSTIGTCRGIRFYSLNLEFHKIEFQLYFAVLSPQRFYILDFFLFGTVNRLCKSREERTLQEHISEEKIISAREFHGTTHYDHNYREIIFTGIVLTRFYCSSFGSAQCKNM